MAKVSKVWKVSRVVIFALPALYLAGLFVASLNPGKIFDYIFSLLDVLHYITGAGLAIYLIALGVWLYEILKHKRRYKHLENENLRIKAVVYDRQQEEERLDQEIKAFEASLPEVKAAPDNNIEASSSKDSSDTPS